MMFFCLFFVCWGRLRLPLNSLEHTQQTSTQCTLFLKLILPILVKMSSGIYIGLLSSATSYFRPLSPHQSSCAKYLSFTPQCCQLLSADIILLQYQCCRISAVLLMLLFQCCHIQCCCIRAVVLVMSYQGGLISPFLLLEGPFFGPSGKKKAFL